jgi:WD40 repeat protein
MEGDAPHTGAVSLNARARSEAEARKRKVPAPVEAKVRIQKTAKVLTGHKDWVLGLSLTKDGNMLVSGDDKGEIIVWDRPAGKELRRWKLKGWAWAVAVEPQGKSLLVSERVPLVFDAGQMSGLKLWNPNTGELKADMSKEFKERMAAAAYSPDGKYLAVARGGETDGLSGKVTLLDPATGKKIKELTPGHMYGATDLVFHPDGKHLLSAGRDTTVKIWRLEDGKLVKELGRPRGGQFKDWFHAVAVSPDGRRIAAADMAGQVQVWTLP